MNLSSILPDVQSSTDERNIPIHRVGIREIQLPIQVMSEIGPQSTVGTFAMAVALPADQKGTHMSRFIALLEEWKDPLDAENLPQMMKDMLVRLHATEGTIEIQFPFFVQKVAPISRLTGVMNYQARWRVNATEAGITVEQTVVTPCTSLCPCSKEISRYGAHNQRSHLTSTIVTYTPVRLEEQIRLNEAAASCPVWSRLKRSDEKYVTEFAYEHPKFVEDIIRDLALAYYNDARIKSYVLEAENFESIHNHSAYATIHFDKG